MGKSQSKIEGSPTGQRKSKWSRSKEPSSNSSATRTMRDPTKGDKTSSNMRGGISSVPVSQTSTQETGSKPLTGKPRPINQNPKFVAPNPNPYRDIKKEPVNRIPECPNPKCRAIHSYYGLQDLKNCKRCGTQLTLRADSPTPSEEEAALNPATGDKSSKRESFIEIQCPNMQCGHTHVITKLYNIEKCRLCGTSLDGYPRYALVD